MRKKVIGTCTRPRLYVFKSNKHIYVQVIDDSENKVLASSSTIGKDNKLFANCKNAQIIGQKIASTIKVKGIEQVVFDRGNNIYHGQIKALADAARKAGLKF